MIVRFGRSDKHSELTGECRRARAGNPGYDQVTETLTRSIANSIGDRMSNATTFALRTASFSDAVGIARVYVKSWQRAYRGIIPTETLQAMNVVRETVHWRRTLARGEGQRIFVIGDQESGIVGFATCGPSRRRSSRGEIYTLYLLPSFERQGLGRRLMAACAEQLLADGYGQGCVWVLYANQGARAFYERLGGELGARDVSLVDSSRLPVVRYDWADLHALEETASGLTDVALPAFLR